MALTPDKANTPKLELIVGGGTRPVEALNTTFTVKAPESVAIPIPTVNTKLDVTPTLAPSVNQSISTREELAPHRGVVKAVLQSIKENAIAAQHTITTVATGAPFVGLLKEFGADTRALALSCIVMAGALIAGGIDSGFLKLRKEQ